MATKLEQARAAYAKAERDANAAYEACPHWDYENQNGNDYDCCVAVHVARDACRKARRALEKAKEA